MQLQLQTVQSVEEAHVEAHCIAETEKKKE